MCTYTHTHSSTYILEQSFSVSGFFFVFWVAFSLKTLWENKRDTLHINDNNWLEIISSNFVILCTVDLVWLACIHVPQQSCFEYLLWFCQGENQCKSEFGFFGQDHAGLINSPSVPPHSLHGGSIFPFCLFCISCVCPCLVMETLSIWHGHVSGKRNEKVWGVAPLCFCSVGRNSTAWFL